MSVLNVTSQILFQAESYSTNVASESEVSLVNFFSVSVELLDIPFTNPTPAHPLLVMFVTSMNEEIFTAFEHLLAVFTGKLHLQLLFMRLLVLFKICLSLVSITASKEATLEWFGIGMVSDVVI